MREKNALETFDEGKISSKYEDLDFNSYKQVKHKDSRWGSENHNRTIYQTDKYFVKVWDKDYIRKKIPGIGINPLVIYAGVFGFGVV